MAIDTIIRRAIGARRHHFPSGDDVPLFTADWRGAVFAHFAIEPAHLQPSIPFELDTRAGHAYVSLVAFTQSNLRPSIGGPVAAWLITPLASHEFLNLRTYVRVGGLRGIYFVAEWIPNRLAVLLGPRTYGLPYRLGRLRYEVDKPRGLLRGQVRTNGDKAFKYEADFSAEAARFASAPDGSLDQFLLERYVAFTRCHGVSRRFLVDHAPWPQQRVDLNLIEHSILDFGGAWSRHARFVGANFSTGVTGVTISAPRTLDGPAELRAQSVEPAHGFR
jgi:uncharacterized protein YqjF (DUF2071 family)